MSDEKVPPPDPSAAPAPPTTEGSVTPTEPTPPVENGVPPVPVSEIRELPDPGPAPTPAPVPAPALAPTPASVKTGFLGGLFGKQAAPTAKTAPGQGKPHDVFREVAETVVFVVVLVLLLKTFIAEAFVIPTGSMATTLWGYQKPVTCPECAFNFPVNCSSQVDPANASDREDVIGCTCPNCRVNIYFQWTSPQIMPHILRQWNEDETHRPMIEDPPWHSGDRVLVAKFLYESGLRKPARHDVVVFKYPDGPQRNQTAMNYIKRLIGKPNETIGIHAGDVYVAQIAYTDKKESPEDLRALRKEMREDEANETFKADVIKPMDDPNRKFQIIRKSPEVLLALARPVYNNDHQPTDLAGLNMPRWHANKGWKPDAPMFPKKFAAEPAGDDVQWLRYRHLLRDPANRKIIDAKPQLITDFMGYNTAMTPRGQKPSGQNWVGDLILETEVQLDRAAKGDELWLELSKGIDRFQARFDLETGVCTLVRISTEKTSAVKGKDLVFSTDSKGVELGKKDTALKGSGTFKVRLANVDERLTLWVNDALPFGDGQDYDPPTKRGPDREINPAKNNDLNPAGIAVKGKPGLSVAKLQLGRDTYYTVNVEYSRADGEVPPGGWGDPNAWGKLRELPYKTLYVQPEHYLCMGDNSPESSDGRAWGLVPDRLLLGRALLVYFPFKPFGAETRIGVIK